MVLKLIKSQLKTMKNGFKDEETDEQVRSLFDNPLNLPTFHFSFLSYYVNQCAKEPSIPGFLALFFESPTTATAGVKIIANICVS